MNLIISIWTALDDGWGFFVNALLGDETETFSGLLVVKEQYGSIMNSHTLRHKTVNSKTIAISSLWILINFLKRLPNICLHLQCTSSFRAPPVKKIKYWPTSRFISTWQTYPELIWVLPASARRTDISAEFLEGEKLSENSAGTSHGPSLGAI